MSEMKKRKQQLRERRTIRTRAKISGSAERPRLAVFRSLKHISVQAIDDVAGKTLSAVNDKGLTGKPMERAAEVGKLIAAKLLEQKVEKAVFDKRSYRYHGQVKALADGARTGGLQF